jgi:ubiquitin-protein ligase
VNICVEVLQADTVYEGGTFVIDIVVPENYPCVRHFISRPEMIFRVNIRDDSGPILQIRPTQDEV